MLDDPDSDNWNDYKMHGEKITIYDNKLLFRDTGVVFTLKRYILSMVTDYDFNGTDSPDAKEIFNFLYEMHFDKHEKGGKSSRERTLINN